MAGPTLGDAFIRVTGDVSQFKKSVERGLRSVRAASKNWGATIGRDVNTGLAKEFRAVNPFKILGDNFEKTAMQSREQLNNLIRTGFFIGPLITAIAAAIGSLGTALTSLITVVSRATPSLFVLANSLSAVLQAGVVVQQAFRGIGEALQEAIAADSPDNARAIEDALRRVERARIRLRNVINRDQPEALAAARERAVQAERSAAEALRSSEAALRSYNEAQRRTLDALEDLNDARDRARERIQQLRFETEESAISEQQARLSFERARDSLQAVQDLPPNSRARQEAELAFAEADLNLRRAIDRNADLKKEEEAATRAGVEGSEEVVAAKRAIEQAIQSEADAQYRAAQATLAVAEARRRADQAAADAAEGGRVQQEINERIAEAREQLKDAERALEDARNPGGGGGRDPEDELSPAADAFVQYLKEIRKEFNVLRDEAATGFFPVLTRAIERVRGRLGDLAPLFRGTGEVVGGVADEISKAFFEAEQFSKVETIWKNNDYLIGSFGRSLGNIIRALQNLLIAADPVTRRFADWIERLTSNWAESTGENIDGLTEKFNNAGDVAADLGEILGGWFDIFREIGRIVMAPGGAGEGLLDFFKDANKEALEFFQAGGPDGDGSLVEQFRQGTDNGLKLLSIISDIIKVLFNLGSSENFGTFLDSVERSIPNFEAMGQEFDKALPAFGDFIEQFSLLLSNFTEGEQAESFFTVLTGAITRVNELFENEGVQAAFRFLGEIKAITIAFGTLFSVAEFFGYAFSGTGILPFIMIRNLSKRVGDLGVQLENMAAGGGPLSSVQKKGSRTFLGMGTNISKLLLPKFLLIAAAVLAIAGIFIYMYNQSETFRESVDRIVDKLDPLFTAIGNVFSYIGQIFRDLWEFFKQSFNFEEFEERLSGFVDNIGYVLLGIGWLVKGAIAPLIVLAAKAIAIGTLIFGVITGIVKFIMDAVAGIFLGGLQFLEGLGQFIAGVFEAIWVGLRLVGNFIKGDEAGIRAALDDFGEAMTKIGEGIMNMLMGVVRAIAGVLQGLVNFFVAIGNAVISLINLIISAWNGLTKNLKVEIPDWAIFGDLRGKTFSLGTVPLIPKIPAATFASSIPDFGRKADGSLGFLAQGGIVPAIAGGMLAVIGEGGRSERVEPLDPDGLSKRDKAMIALLSGGMGGGATINVYPSPGMNEAELAEMVSRRLAREMRAGALR